MDFRRVTLPFAAPGSINSVSAENKGTGFLRWREWLIQLSVTQMDPYPFRLQGGWVSFIVTQSIYSFFTDYIF